MAHIGDKTHSPTGPGSYLVARLPDQNSARARTKFVFETVKKILFIATIRSKKLFNGLFF